MKYAACMVLLPTLGMLAACDSSQVAACEAQLKDRLKSPASYKRVKFSFTQIDSSIHKPPYDSVTITYDAANSFNALLRDEETCFYRPGTTNEFDPYANEAIDMDAMTDTNTVISRADAAINATDIAVEPEVISSDRAAELTDEIEGRAAGGNPSDDDSLSNDVTNDAGE